ncbi:MAG: DUF4230 domain-containing protein [Muribaculaceae bacterium]|nr:DUF4230 domain-containing protein [Muribaculaceae bacterium]
MKNILKFLFIIPLILACTRKDVLDHTGLYEEIRHVNKMEFASMAVTKTVKTERSDWYKVGKRIAVYSFDSYLKAYIDMYEFDIEDMEFDENNKTVKVTLPPVRIEIAGRDMEMKKEYENVGLFRTEIDSKERAKMKEKASSDLMKELEGDPEYKQRLDETARRKARSYFESLFKNAGYTAFIRFSDESPDKGDFRTPTQLEPI